MASCCLTIDRSVASGEREAHSIRARTLLVCCCGVLDGLVPLGTSMISFPSSATPILDAHGETLSVRYAKTCLALRAEEDAPFPEVTLDLAVKELFQCGPALGTNWAFSLGTFECEHCLLRIHTDMKETVRLLAMAVCEPSAAGSC